MIDRVRLVDLELELERPFRIARGTSETCRELVLCLEADGTRAYGSGHASPSVTGESHEQARRALGTVEAADLDPHDVEGSLDALPDDAGPAARAAIDLALHDLAGRLEDRPVHELLGLPAGERPSAATVTVDEPSGAAEQARAWTKRGFSRLKLKVDADTDVLALVDAVDDAIPDTMREPLPEPELWIDANEALTLEEGLELAPRLDERGVAVFEQPLPREELDGMARLARESPVPVVADEPVQSPADVARVAALDAPLAVNVKVQKVGGLLAARECLHKARAGDLDVLVGCNVETGLGIAAGASLVGAVRWADLDGNLFLARDPFPLVRPMPGHAGTPASAGLGPHPDPRFEALRA